MKMHTDQLTYLQQQCLRVLAAEGDWVSPAGRSDLHGLTCNALVRKNMAEKRVRGGRKPITEYRAKCTANDFCGPPAPGEHYPELRAHH